MSDYRIAPAYFGSDPVFVDGLLMLDYGLLSQMAQNGESICLYVVACVDGDKLCFDSVTHQIIHIQRGLSGPLFFVSLQTFFKNARKGFH
ncbi:MAG: hypothetical protein MJZ87_07615 [Bacteroidales bacterium]|nr:hypothetical protein [Bacteroidales bacterium]